MGRAGAGAEPEAEPICRLSGVPLHATNPRARARERERERERERNVFICAGAERSQAKCCNCVLLASTIVFPYSKTRAICDSFKRPSAIAEGLSQVSVF